MNLKQRLLGPSSAPPCWYAPSAIKSGYKRKPLIQDYCISNTPQGTVLQADIFPSTAHGLGLLQKQCLHFLSLHTPAQRRLEGTVAKLTVCTQCSQAARLLSKSPEMQWEDKALEKRYCFMCAQSERWIIALSTSINQMFSILTYLRYKARLSIAYSQDYCIYKVTPTYLNLLCLLVGLQCSLVVS